MAVASALNPSTHGEITSHIPSTTLTHSSHAITLNRAISAAAAIRIPRIAAFDIAAFDITAFNVKGMSVWYCSAQGETTIQMPRIRFNGSCQCLIDVLGIVLPP